MPATRSTRVLPALTIFLGSFLLFDVQPMLGRTLLPSFGGTAAVWVVCLCAYQVLLLAGYAYAHAMTRYSARAALHPAQSGRFSRFVQQKLHLALLALAVLWTLGFAFLRPALKACIGNSGQPALEVLFCVLVFAGLPYVLLASGSALVQAWVHRSESQADAGDAARTGTNVYRLYAISNLGSFCGLFFYPFVLEPYVSLTAQWFGFAVCLLVYAGFMAKVARGAVNSEQLAVSSKQLAVNSEQLAVSSKQLAVSSEQSTSHRTPNTDNCSLLTANCSLPTPPTAHCSLLTANCSLPTPPTAHCSLLTANCSLPTPPGANCSLLTAHCSLPTPWLWLLLPATSCFLLNAVTTHLSLDVMALPLLWVVLLGAFLASYVLGFGRHSAVWMKWGELLGAVCLVVLCFTLKSTGGMGILIPNLIFGIGLILFGCSFLHGWLYTLRPAGADLTRYYLFNALGGALGGTLASLVAPMVFRTVAEYPIALFLFIALAMFHAWFSRPETGAGRICDSAHPDDKLVYQRRAGFPARLAASGGL